MTKVHEEAMFRAIELLAEANTRAELAESAITEINRDVYMDGYLAAKSGRPRQSSLLEWLRGYDEFHEVSSQ
jgi:hypothetical protein